MQDYQLLPSISSSSDVPAGPAPTRKVDGLLFVGLMLTLALLGGMAGWWLGPLVTRIGLLVIPTGEKAAWYMTRSTATVAYVVLMGAVVWGLLLSTKAVKAAIPAPLAMALHGALSWLAVGLGVLHASLLLLDRYYNYTISDLLIPFTGPYRPGWTGVGILSLYGLALISASFWVRKWLGYRTWRVLHFLNFPLFGMVTLHGLMAGTDSTRLGTQMMYIFCGLLVVLLTIYRVVHARTVTKSNGAKQALSPAQAAPAQGTRAFAVEG